MLRFLRTGVVFAAVSAQAFASRPARAQTTAAAPAVHNASNQTSPERFVGGHDLGLSTRPVQLTPTGVSYSDCVSDMTLSFPLLLTGFDGSELLEVWAGTTDCGSQTNRGVGAVPTCWEVGPPIAGLVASAASPVSKNITVRVQDIAGHVNSVPQSMQYFRVGPEACTSQTVDTAQQVTVYFVPTTSSGADVTGSTTYKLPVTVDLVAPPPPAVGMGAAGDTFVSATWTPNGDPDTIGYNVYVDPFPGTEIVGAEPVLVCDETGATPVADATTQGAADSATQGGDDGASDALSASSDAMGDDAIAPDSGVADSAVVDSAPTATIPASPMCRMELMGGNGTVGTGGKCASSNLSGASGVVLDAAATSTPNAQTSTDAAGDDSGTAAASDDAAVAVTGGGISNVNPRFLYQPDSNTGITVAAATATSLNITGLTNGVQYNIAVAAVDALGNVGPLSALQCATPAPVKDFWRTYRDDGGQAGGGFCALEAAGAPAGSAAMLAGVLSVAAAAVRRRRRRKR